MAVILHLDTEPALLAAVKDALRPTHDVYKCLSVAELEDLVRRTTPALVILDPDLFYPRGASLVYAIQRISSTIGLYIVTRNDALGAALASMPGVYGVMSKQTAHLHIKLGHEINRALARHLIRNF